MKIISVSIFHLRKFEIDIIIIYPLSFIPVARYDLFSCLCVVIRIVVITHRQ